MRNTPKRARLQFSVIEIYMARQSYQDVPSWQRKVNMYYFYDCNLPIKLATRGVLLCLVCLHSKKQVVFLVINHLT